MNEWTLIDYSKMADEQAEYGREETVREKGFFILPSELFCNILNSVDKDGMSKTEKRMFCYYQER